MTGQSTGQFDRRNLAMLLLQARENVMGLFRPILKQFALTEQQWRVIRALSEHPTHALEAGQLAKICCILSPSLTGMLERMERDALIHRTRPASDQRKVMVALTPQSRALVKRISPLIDAEYRELARTIGQHDLDDIYRRLDQLIALPLDADSTPAHADQAS